MRQDESPGSQEGSESSSYQGRLMDEMAFALGLKVMHRNWICNDKQRKQKRKKGDGTSRSIYRGCSSSTARA